MKILHVVNVAFVIPYFFGEQLKYFSGKGYNIHLACSPSPKLPDYARSYGFQYVEIEILRVFSIWKDIRAAFTLWRYIRAKRIDIVCGHTPKGGLLAMVAAFFAGVPKRIFFRHGLVYETSTGLRRFVLVNAERIASLLATEVVCVSPYLVERSRADHLTRPSKMRLLNIGSCNGVDALGQFNPDNLSVAKLDLLRRKLGLAADHYVVGYTGRLVGDKGITELVEAFSRMAADDDCVRLLLVGPLEERDRLPDTTLHTIRTDPRIIHTGLVEGGIEYYYALMSILVLCTHREGLGTSILEASAMQLPVLTTAHTGSRDAIIDGVTGSYILPAPESLYEALRRYRDDPQLARNQGQAGRAFILRNFEQRSIWQQIEKLYH